MGNGRTASHWSLGRQANLWPGTSRPYVLWVIRMWQQRQGRHDTGAAVERAAELKIAKYSGLEDKCIFQPIAVESLGLLNETACQFLKDLGRRISAQSGDDRVPSCSKGYLLSFSDVTLSCSTTVLRRQTTWADGHSSVYSFLTIFSSPSVY